MAVGSVVLFDVLFERQTAHAGGNRQRRKPIARQFRRGAERTGNIRRAEAEVAHELSKVCVVHARDERKRAAPAFFYVCERVALVITPAASKRAALFAAAAGKVAVGKTNGPAMRRFALLGFFGIRKKVHRFFSRRKLRVWKLTRGHGLHDGGARQTDRTGKARCARACSDADIVIAFL